MTDSPGHDPDRPDLERMPDPHVAADEQEHACCGTEHDD